MLKFFGRTAQHQDAPAGIAGTTPLANLHDQSEDTQRRLQFLRTLNAAWLALGIISLLSLPLYSNWRLVTTLAVGTAFTFVGTKVLLKLRMLLTARIFFCACFGGTFWAMFMTMLYKVGGPEAFYSQIPVLMLMSVAALVAGILVGPRSALIAAGIITVVTIATRLIWSPESEARPSIIVAAWLLAAVGYLYEHTLRHVFSAIRAARSDLESTVATRTAELRESIARLESLAAQLTAANNDLEFFSASVAHDLRGPLLAIEGYTRALQDDLTQANPQALEALKRLVQVETRMGRLIDGLLSFARLGHHALQRQPLAMSTIAQRVADDLVAREHHRAIEITVTDLPNCHADPLLIEQVLINLIGNAIKFTRPRLLGKIEISGERTGNEFIYRIKDNGVGFDMEKAERLFNSLQRLHAQDEFEGTGIGLAVVQRIIKRHGGRVWAKSEVGSGAEFVFALPATRDAMAATLQVAPINSENRVTTSPYLSSLN